MFRKVIRLLSHHLATNNKLIFVFDESDKLFQKGSAYFSGQFLFTFRKINGIFCQVSFLSRAIFIHFSKRGQFVACKLRRKRSQEEVKAMISRGFFGRMWSLPFCPPALKTKREDQQQRRRSTFFSHNFGQERDWDSTWNLLVSGRHAPNLKGFSNNNNFGPWRNEKIVSLASISGSNSCNELC